MKVKELVEYLKTCDPESIVVMSRDSEGNGYDELWSCAEMAYAEGEVYEDSTKLEHPEDTDPEDQRTPGEGGYVAAVCFWP